MQDGFLPDFTRVSLEDMKKVKLMNRIDTKFVTTENSLQKLLAMAADDYWAQEIDGEILLPYYTRYYDTENCEMYNHHLHGKKTRKKIRVRQYVGSGVEFLEVKRKNNKGRTDKKRISTHGLSDFDFRSFITQMAEYDPERLSPQIENRFRRLTLVNKAMTERLTIDMGIKFHNVATQIDSDLTGLVIIELKRDGRTPSPIKKMLNQLRIKQSGFSKYCIGMALTNPKLNTNRFMPRLHKFKKMLTEPETSFSTCESSHAVGNLELTRVIYAN